MEKRSIKGAIDAELNTLLRYPSTYEYGVFFLGILDTKFDKVDSPDICFKAFDISEIIQEVLKENKLWPLTAMETDGPTFEQVLKLESATKHMRELIGGRYKDHFHRH